MRVHVEFNHTFDPENWRRSHAAGIVPSALPYGFECLTEHGIDLNVRPQPSGRTARAAGALRRVAGGFDFGNGLRDRRRRDCDLAMSWDERTGVPAALRGALPGEPPAAMGVIWLTEPDAPIPRQGRWIAEAALRRATAVWALSSAQLHVLESVWGVPRRRLHFLLKGIDDAFWSPDGFDPEPDFVVGAGNDRHRDHGLLVDAMRDLHGQRPRLRFELVSHHAIAVPSQLGRRHPQLAHPDVRALYRRASVVAVALRHNLHVSGINVILEAMACARPVVVTDTPGMSEYVKHGETGILVPPGDAKALASAVGELLADPARAQELGGAARLAVETTLSVGPQAKRLSDILRA